MTKYFIKQKTVLGHVHDEIIVASIHCRCIGVFCNNFLDFIIIICIGLWADQASFWGRFSKLSNFHKRKIIPFLKKFKKLRCAIPYHARFFCICICIFVVFIDIFFLSLQKKLHLRFFHFIFFSRFCLSGFFLVRFGHVTFNTLYCVYYLADRNALNVP